MANPYVLLREEFDDWAILFDPDTGHGFGLNPIGVCLWKLLDGRHSIDEMLSAVRRDTLDVPKEAEGQILTFVEELAQHGLATYDVRESRDGRERILRRTTAESLPDGWREPGQLASRILRYERPRLESFTLDARAQGVCITGGGCCNGSHASGGMYCNTGNSPGHDGLGHSCFINGNSASEATGWACDAVGNNASGGDYACDSGNSATGGNYSTCYTGNSGGICMSGSSA